MADTSPQRPLSPPRASSEKPIILSNSSSKQPIFTCTPTISQETSNKRRFLLPRQSLRLQAQGGPTSVLTKAKKRAQKEVKAAQLVQVFLS